MLSINIPVYNVEVYDLVRQLTEQAMNLKIPYEIRVYDDRSEPVYCEKNKKTVQLPNVTYTEMESNIGRAAIRNRMGLDAKYPYLLFIDADSKIMQKDYLTNYLQNIEENVVLCGGTGYSESKPADPKKLLRWHYGRKREAVSAEIRNGKKGFIITSNNFLIEKKVFEKIRFRENVREYGHEDTLLGYDLFQAGIGIRHIDNPVEHTGLEDSRIFLEKTKSALKNLQFISSELLAAEKDFSEQVHFLRQFRRLTRIIPPILFRIFYLFFRKEMEKNLTGKKPRLFWFDLYKLCFFATIKNR